MSAHDNTRAKTCFPAGKAGWQDDRMAGRKDESRAGRQDDRTEAGQDKE